MDNVRLDKHRPIIDPISGIPLPLLSEMIYCFFPTSTRHVSRNPGYIWPHEPYIYRQDYCEAIVAGSIVENLMLPGLWISKPGNINRFLVTPDQDTMFNPGLSDTYVNMSLKMDKDRPVLCRIKHGRPTCMSQIEMGFPEMEKGSFLNSVAVKQWFEYYLIKIHKNLSTYDFTFQQHFSSPGFSSSNLQNEQYDHVLCIKVNFEHKLKLKFKERLHKDKWPMKSVTDLDELLSEHVYAVPKPHKNSETGDLRWRLSFSVIEVKLAWSLTDIQRRCYRVLKALIKFNVNEEYLKENEKFLSYYLKTSMFWICEQTFEDSWKIPNLGRHWLTLLENIIESLEKRKLPHYFISSYNLLDDKPIRIINNWLEKFKQIRKNPFEAFTKFWKKEYFWRVRSGDRSFVRNYYRFSFLTPMKMQ